MSAPDLAAPLRAAILADSGIASQLPTFKSAPAVFTRRPVPKEAPYPMIVISPDITNIDNGGLDNTQLVIQRDVTVYGQNEEAADYRLVETLAWALRDLFHQERNAITVTGWCVASLSCAGPRIAPTDDDHSTGRLITVTARLARLEA